MVLDPAGLDFCDRTGISALLSARIMAIEQRGDTALAAVPANAARILGIVGLDRVFAIHPDVATVTARNSLAH
ncbi:STAS domain-containing protein [Streptomyces sp. NPDC087844]|uniref:STAS domain-containing protein n=1 Tax=Streptomyces sp. NPDC087844 TaxID=3365805 RepID=UPI003810CDBE